MNYKNYHISKGELGYYINTFSNTMGVGWFKTLAKAKTFIDLGYMS